MILKDLKRIAVIGLGLLGGSIVLAVSRIWPGVRTTGYTHRPGTRRKARRLLTAARIVDDIKESVSAADLVIIATPIYSFEGIFQTIGGSLRRGCIVTDVGSTKVLPHRWAAKYLPKSVYYVGSHPIAGSEQRGVEFARDDLFERAACILTKTKNTRNASVQVLKRFWSSLGCCVKLMTPAEHDRVFANISHLPHITAAALINASKAEELKFAGKGFVDTSRIASGPANIWADVLATNAKNSVKSIERIISELEKLKRAIGSADKKEIERLLEAARNKRAALIKYKMKREEIIS
ncbi:Cyclohexadienyl dehydrogenase [subsurface metagenome]